jgi:hypothetical protein
MKNKLIIEGQEFELPQSLVDEIKLKLAKPKRITYEDVAKELFHKGNPRTELCYYLERTEIGNSGKNSTFTKDINLISLATSKKQLEKLLAINKLMNVAKYLNGNFIFKTLQDKWFIARRTSNIPNQEEIKILQHSTVNYGIVYFKTKELTQTAIDILGEDVIKLALSTDY